MLLTAFPLLAAANPCVPAPRVPGTPIEAPHAVFEAYVVEVGAPQVSSSAFGLKRMRHALVEVVRSYHGPYGPGQEVETITIEGASPCLGTIESGAHVLVGSKTGGAFEILANLSNGSAMPAEPIAALGRVSGEPRHSRRHSLGNATLRGEIDGALASDLYARARPDRRAQSEINSSGNLVQVSWGKAFGGNDARNKVIFEHAASGWVEILRYQAPAPTPARNRPRRAKQRTLWAQPAPGLRIGRFEVVMPPFNT